VSIPKAFSHTVHKEHMTASDEHWPRGMGLLFEEVRALTAGFNNPCIGGWALQAHGYSRNTVDVDCMTAVEDDAQLGEELGKVGFECFAEMPAFRRFRHRLDAGMVLDVMRVDAGTFAKIWGASEPTNLNGIPFRVPALGHLIALKLHAGKNEHRAGKDIEDIIQLLSANPGKLPADELRQLCNQFGAPGITLRLSAFL
jgi:hypothetical protein